jgi:hypothetical protein
MGSATFCDLCAGGNYFSATFTAWAVIYTHIWPGVRIEPPAEPSSSIIAPPTPTSAPTAVPDTKPPVPEAEWQVRAPSPMQEAVVGSKPPAPIGGSIVSLPPASKIPGYKVYMDGKLIGHVEKANVDRKGSPYEIIVRDASKKTVTVPVSVIEWREPEAVAIIHREYPGGHQINLAPQDQPRRD